MSGFVSINLQDLIDVSGEERAGAILGSYRCPLNSDIEAFAQTKAIAFAKQGIARTHLVFEARGNDFALAGFYALALKVLSVPKGNLSNSTKRRLLRFGIENQRTESIDVAAPLIAQLGRNYAEGAGVIAGGRLLGIACTKVSGLQRELGGKLVYLECEPAPRLIAFYERNGFRCVHPDYSQADGLCQMIRYLG